LDTTFENPSNFKFSRTTNEIQARLLRSMQQQQYWPPMAPDDSDVQVLSSKDVIIV
jgi:hypothetical protein